MIRSSSAGTDVASWPGGVGCSLRILVSVESREVPRNGLWPVTISYSTEPKLKMSDRASSGRPSACSGDMYATVPSTVPSSVLGGAVMVAASCEASAGSSSFARPKSRSLRRP